MQRFFLFPPLTQCNTFFKRNLKKKLKIADIRGSLKGRERGLESSPLPPPFSSQVPIVPSVPSRYPVSLLIPRAGVGAVLSECSDPQDGREGLKDGAAEGVPSVNSIGTQAPGGGSEGLQ